MGVFTTIFSSALVLVALTAVAEAGGYGGGHQYSYAQFQQPQMYAYYQPPRVQYYTTGVGYGAGYGAGAGAGYGLNAGLANAGGISGGIAGSIIPIVIIFVILAILAPVLIGSLVSSNDVVFGSS
ncbi:alanine and glycine-rich protein [Magallana gigas]|uniref:Uncharacterized protein n=1 Tax=Magallana gigas TaxID=29159 RepID=A0A8W8HY57_MAGGI|nr:alanine and glycine-rich protein [Crassostrea gigas]|eukprot:XP_011451597.1 PREDICTED: alanine and glycine-rich protein-like [Crassostrea gigas]